MCVIAFHKLSGNNSEFRTDPNVTGTPVKLICYNVVKIVADFPDGTPTPKFGAKTYYLARFLPKTA